MQKFKNQPSVFIQVKGIGWTFLVDTSYRYNLIRPCTVDFFYEEYPPSQETIKFHEWSNLNFPTREEPVQIPLYFFEDVFRIKKGIKNIKCKDGINRGCESVMLKFECDGKTYSDLFYLDQSLCNYCTPKNKTAGILGTDFLKKHKWIINFNKLSIYDKDK